MARLRDRASRRTRWSSLLGLCLLRLVRLARPAGPDPHCRQHGSVADQGADLAAAPLRGSDEHTSELQSLMRNSSAGFWLNKKKIANTTTLVYIPTYTISKKTI